MIVHTRSAATTEALGHRLGQLLQAGDVVGLWGDLGIGKTVLARGIAAGVGATGYVASPTYTFIREYRGMIPMYHVDLYRVDHLDQLEDLGLDEILAQPAVVVVEWAQKAGRYLPPEHLRIALRFPNGEDDRQLEFIPRGARYERIVAALASTWPADS